MPGATSALPKCQGDMNNWISLQLYPLFLIKTFHTNCYFETAMSSAFALMLPLLHDVCKSVVKRQAKVKIRKL
jgi:CDP-diglyceride synthetase